MLGAELIKMLKIAKENDIFVFLNIFFLIKKMPNTHEKLATNILKTKKVA